MPICPVCWEEKDASHFYKWRRKCKECTCNTMALYYKENRDKISSRKKAYRNTHKDRINAERREKYHQNKAIYLERAKRYYEDNREDVLIRARENAIKRKENDFITFKLRGIFRGMKHRCYNPKDKCYKYYWWKWVRIEWETFEDFYSDMCDSYIEHYNQYGEKNTQIDRINNNGNYSKENCRWVTAKQNNPDNHAKEREIRKICFILLERANAI